jgi:hypothetical protein
MIGVGVAVLFVGLMRIADKGHMTSIIKSTQGCDRYVITYESDSGCGGYFTGYNSSRLLVVSPSTIKY